MAWFCFAHLLFIYFLFFSCSLPICFAQNAITDTTFQLNDKCNDPGNSPGWWFPLQHADSKLRDPCRIHQDLKNEGIFIACCFGNHLDSVGPGACGPCTLETYNLYAACMTCSDNALSTNVAPTIGSETQYIHLDGEADTHPDNVSFPSHSQFNKGTRNIPLDKFVLPPWVNTTLKGDLFDPPAAVTFAQQVLSAGSSSVSAPSTSSSSSTSTTTTSSSESTRLPPASPFPTASVRKSSKVGVIVGGTIGGVILVGATIFLAVFITKRQRTKRMISDNRHDSFGVRHWHRLDNLEPYIIASREEMRENIGSIGKSHGKGRPIYATNFQHLTRITQLDRTGNISNPLGQRERRELDAGHVFVGTDVEERTLPPNYSDVFRGSNARV